MCTYLKEYSLLLSFSSLPSTIVAGIKTTMYNITPTGFNPNVAMSQIMMDYGYKGGVGTRRPKRLYTRPSSKEFSHFRPPYIIFNSLEPEMVGISDTEAATIGCNCMRY